MLVIRSKPYILLAPAALILTALFAGGIALALAQSAGFFWPTGEHAFTLSHYASILTDREFQSSLLLTASVTAISTALSTVLGVAIALALHHLTRGRKIINALVQLPLAVPHLVMAVLLLAVISQSGLLARIAYAAGVIGSPNQFPILVNDRRAIGIISAYVFKETPFLTVVALAMLARISGEYDALASTLGASPWQRFRHITLPLIAPAVTPASVIVFAFIFGAFEVPFLLGRTYPAMLGVVAQRRFTSVELAERPDAIAVSVLMSLITAVLVWAYLKLARPGALERPTLF